MVSFITHNQRMIVCIFYIYPNVIHMFISGLLIYLKGDLPTFLLIRNYLLCLSSNITRNHALIYIIFEKKSLALLIKDIVVQSLALKQKLIWETGLSVVTRPENSTSHFRSSSLVYYHLLILLSCVIYISFG